MRSHFKPTEPFQYTHYSSCHPPGVSKGFIKGEALQLRLIRTNSSKTTFEENICNFRVRLRMRGYPRHLVEHILSEVKFTERESALQQRQKTQDKPLPFVTQYHPSVPHPRGLISREYGKMALDREPTLTQGNIQGTPFHLLQKGEILKRYTCESKTRRFKVQNHQEKRELCLVCLHSFNLSL